MCVLVSLQDWLFQTQLAASRHDGHLVLHVETHQVTNAQEHLITGPHLLTQRHTGNGITYGWLSFSAPHACAHEIQHHGSTCPCGSTSSMWRTVAPSIPLRTYWPEAELLSLTRKSPLQVRSDSACCLPNLWWRAQLVRKEQRKSC